LKKNKFDEAHIGDALEFLDSISKTSKDARQGCSDVDKLIRKFRKYPGDQRLKPEEVKKVSGLVEKYSSMVDPELRTRFFARIRKRKERRIMADEGVSPARINISGTTKTQLNKIKNKKKIKGEKGYPTYDAVIVRLLRAYEQGRKAKRSKTK
jgi:hypothetical protein